MFVRSGTAKMFKKSALIVCSLLLSLSASAQQPVQKETYESLLEKLKKQDPAVDFTALRFAYTETKEYNPYAGPDENRKAMFAGLGDKQYEAALAASEKMLAANYLDMNAHFVASVSNRELGNKEKADFHKYVFQNLIKSVKDSGDGKAMETAFVVITVDEEYVLFNFMGLRVVSQALVEDKGRHYDKMTAKDPKTDETSVYYFNIDKPFDWLSKSLKKKE